MNYGYPTVGPQIASATSTSGTGSTGSTGSSTPLSADVAARVKQTLAAQSTGINKLNDSLLRNQTRLSGLGKLQSALAEMQASAQSLSSAATGANGVAPSQDASQIGKNVRAFVAAFNAMNGKLQALQAGELKSDAGMSRASAELAQLTGLGGDGFSARSLSAAGITVERNGNLKIDEKALTAALANGPSAVGAVFSNGGKGLADVLADRLAKLSSKDGMIGKESASANKELSSVTAQRTALAKALTAQATALAAIYSRQSDAQTGKPSSLFDMLA
ncbi:MAG: flagellar filament capping protein FliD [Massilia sp.]